MKRYLNAAGPAGRHQTPVPARSGAV